MKNKTNETAFPAFPMMDNLGQAVTPFPGMTKLEYFTLSIYCSRIASGKDFKFEDRYNPSDDAEWLIKLIEEKQQSINKTKDTALKIIQ